MKTPSAVLALAVFAHLAAHAVNQIPDLSISGPEVAMIGGSTNFTLYCENIDEMEIDKIVVACTDGTRWTNDNPSQTTFSWPFTYSPAAPGVYAMEAELWYDTASCHDFDSLHTVKAQFVAAMDVDPPSSNSYVVNTPIAFLVKPVNTNVTLAGLAPPAGWSYNAAKAGWVRTNAYSVAGLYTVAITNDFIFAPSPTKQVSVVNGAIGLTVAPTTLDYLGGSYATITATGNCLQSLSWRRVKDGTVTNSLTGNSTTQTLFATEGPGCYVYSVKRTTETNWYFSPQIQIIDYRPQSAVISGPTLVVPGNDTDYDCAALPDTLQYDYTWLGTKESSANSATLNTRTNMTVQCIVNPQGLPQYAVTGSLDITVLAVESVSASPTAIGYCGPQSIMLTAVLNGAYSTGGAAEWQYKLNGGEWTEISASSYVISWPSNSPPGVYQFRARVQDTWRDDAWRESPTLYIVAITNLTLADEAFPTNGLTISASSTQAFCIAEKPDGTARLKLTGTTFPPSLPPEIAERVRWFVTNAAVQNATGTLNSTVCVLTPDMTAKYARVYTVYAGFDCDSDGLQEKDYQISNTVNAIKINQLFLFEHDDAQRVVVSNGVSVPPCCVPEGDDGKASLPISSEQFPGTSVPMDFNRFHYAFTCNGQVLTNAHLKEGSKTLVLDTHAGTNRVFVFTAGIDINEDEVLDASDYISQMVTIVVTRVQVTSIKFNHNPNASTNDALNIRQDFATPYDLTNGEWVLGGQNLPVCYTTNRSVTIQARIETRETWITTAVVRAESVGANCGLTGVLETTVVFSNGVSTPEYVAMSLEGLTTNCILKSETTWQWKLVKINGAPCEESMNRTGPHTLYTILGEPLSPWGNNPDVPSNAWVTALDFVVATAGCWGVSVPSNALSRIAHYLHSGHGLTYDVNEGASAYAENHLGGTYKLSEYLAKTGGSSLHRAGNIVNCYDQAGGLVTLGRLIGIPATYRFMNPFGYITNVNLVGVGECNNPFYPQSVSGLKIAGSDELEYDRTKFSNHAFSEYQGFVYDACAGPCVGTRTEAQYVSDTVDRSSQAEAREAGNTSNISSGDIAIIE